MNGARFEDLPKPFVCVASEIRTGHEIWLSSGLLITAMRASYALPGVFEPVAANHEVYDRLFAEFPGLYKAQKGMFGRLNR